MGMHLGFNPIEFSLEFIYSAIVILLCAYVFYKTKEMYSLTRHKGIDYFRKSFLYFGLAYGSRFIFHVIQLTIFTFDFFIPRRMLFPISFLFVGYFSTLALIYLALSTYWKKINNKGIIIYTLLAVIFVSLVSVVTHSPYLLAVVQLPLLIFIVYSNYKRKSRKRSNTRIIYFLISIFWLLNLFVLHFRKMLALEFRLIIDIASLGVFIALAQKVSKWTK